MSGRKDSHRRQRLTTSRMSIDVAGILSVKHSCQGCPRGTKPCCSAYEVCVTSEEMAAIVGYSKDIVRLHPYLGCGDGLNNVFEEVEPGIFALDTDDNGTCVFAYRRKGRLLCSLHSTAVALGLEVQHLKPKSCLLWPLMAAEDGSTVTIHDNALNFPCNTAESRPKRKVDVSLSKSIELVFGVKARRLVEKAAREGRSHIVISRCF